MTISGGIKFFERNTALFSSGTTAAASSNSASANNILTNRQLTYWQSSGSDDTTTETITVTFNKTVTIDRILLNRINFKQFTIKYDVTGTPTDFTTVVGLDGALGGGITETAFADETAYYEVDSISTTVIYITATKTQITDQEKIIYNLFTTAELGTLESYPNITNLQFSRNSKKSKVLSGLENIQKSFDTASFSLTFKSHPSQSDMNLITTLYDEEESFLVWICGGRRGSTYFRYDLKGYGLRDIFNMQADGPITPSYPNSIYVNAPNNSIKLVPSI
jgi:hypothetical protein